MGLRDELQADIAQEFDSDLADAVQSFSCERKIKAEWDPLTETHREIKQTYTGRGVLFGSYSQYEIQTLGVLATDKKAVVLQNEVTMKPKIDDEWFTPLGMFRVIHIQQDPAETIWKCQLRKV
ncbi:glutamate 5-kinase [Acinetobacter proteolyticus]|uniref:Glutamate 5-kinase n=1 Tax=Acinetobacter proteolyticus TaxID=1776741 RepID=A0A2N0WEU8_9GAMM|nr:glutamate 5-kinase [Acinetobacter proteolyticus]PKF33411.1 glutamate 5-kinase [Acinetobacter proteolyticus]